MPGSLPFAFAGDARLWLWPAGPVHHRSWWSLRFHRQRASNIRCDGAARQHSLSTVQQGLSRCLYLVREKLLPYWFHADTELSQGVEVIHVEVLKVFL